MENASKALIIAGSMLLLILVLSFAVYLFGKMAGDAANMYGDLEESDITEFNQKFLNYDGKDNLKIQDVVSIFNLARNNNINGKFPITITVSFNSSDIGSVINGKEEDYRRYINSLLTNTAIDKRFSCQVQYGTNSKLIGSVAIN